MQQFYDEHYTVIKPHVPCHRMSKTENFAITAQNEKPHICVKIECVFLLSFKLYHIMSVLKQQHDSCWADREGNQHTIQRYKGIHHHISKLWYHLPIIC